MRIIELLAIWYLLSIINSKSSQSYRFEQKLSERIQNWNGKRLQRTRFCILFFFCPAAFYWNIQSQKNPKNDNNAPQYEWSWKYGFSTNIICAHRCHDHPLNFPPIHNRCHVTWAMLSLSFSMPPLPHCHFSFADNSIFLSLQQRNKQKKERHWNRWRSERDKTSAWQRETERVSWAKIKTKKDGNIQRHCDFCDSPRFRVIVRPPEWN